MKGFRRLGSIEQNDANDSFPMFPDQTKQIPDGRS